ncbi:hypothetical protein [Devosia faecipullorum]|uniref:hypothetical protein n=1 Tax=Devosia faecipullorum TaxID=2755039 RepID=UPI00187B826F|nr:hypothetical protein [Devosia faecipullorum]MBE7733701.1 hypothetical protein [Devosia faecipullorum]
MTFLMLAAMAGLVLAAGSAPDHVGEMTISYLPKMCLVAPCPPGIYTIDADGKRIAAGDVIVIQTEDGQTQYRGMYIDIETVTGQLWIGREGRSDADGVLIPPGMLVVQIDGDVPAGE